jgi:hypothetical protein
MLAFEEERQLIARLRLAEAPAPDTDRRSYSYLFRRLGRPTSVWCGLIDVQVA